MKLTKQQRTDLKMKFGGHCAYCGCELDDEYLEKKDVLLSHTTYGELIKLLNKSKDFQPYMFWMGY